MNRNLSLIILLVILCLGQVIAEPCGDVNSKDGINIVDALLIAQFYVGLDPADFDEDAADVNADGKINIVDALLIAQYYVGLITELPGCNPTPTPAPTSTPGLVTYELQAETEATWSSGGEESINTGYTGNGYVNTDNSIGEWIQWSIDAESETNAHCVFRYASGSGDRSMDLIVNGNNIASLTFPATGSWTTWVTEEATFGLIAGSNTIRLVATTDDGAPNMDKIDITTGSSIVTPTPTLTPGPTGTPGPTHSIEDSPIGFASLNGGTTGGMGGQTVTASTYSQLKSYAESSTRYIIMVEGTISNGSGGGKIGVNSNKSIIGVGSTAFLQGVGIEIASKNNVIIRNLRISLVGVSNPGSVNGGDNISIHGSSKNIWIDHCELFSEDPDVMTDIDRYDGLIDIKHQTGFITISWCYLHDHHKGGIVGASDSDLYSNRKITFHHNYYKKVKLRVPMYRGSTGHFFNNYIVGAKDASEIRTGTCVRVEKNYYEALHYSIYTPNDYPGRAERIDNIEVSRADRPYPADCTADIPYNYADVLTTNTEDVKIIVPQNAGVGKL